MTSDTAPARWFKSSRSDSTGECVEVAWLDDTTIGVRDSKNPAGPTLTFTSVEWTAFTLGLRVNSTTDSV